MFFSLFFFFYDGASSGHNDWQCAGYRWTTVAETHLLYMYICVYAGRERERESEKLCRAKQLFSARQFNYILARVGHRPCALFSPQTLRRKYTTTNAKDYAYAHVVLHTHIHFIHDTKVRRDRKSKNTTSTRGRRDIVAHFCACVRFLCKCVCIFVPITTHVHIYTERRRGVSNGQNRHRIQDLFIRPIRSASWSVPAGCRTSACRDTTYTFFKKHTFIWIFAVVRARRRWRCRFCFWYLDFFCLFVGFNPPRDLATGRRCFSSSFPSRKSTDHGRISFFPSYKILYTASTITKQVRSRTTLVFSLIIIIV